MTLVGARRKLPGMRNWTYAEGVLRLRAAVLRGGYSELWQRRLRAVA